MRILLSAFAALLIPSLVYGVLVWLLPPWPPLIYFLAVCWYIGFRLLLRFLLQQRRAYEHGAGIEQSLRRGLHGAGDLR